MNRFVIAEPRRCIGCHTCEIACVMAHPGGKEALAEGNFNPRLQLIKSTNVTMPVQCHHCEDAPCVNVCPNGAISYVDGSVQVHQGLCVGCKTCALACPFGAMDMVMVPVGRRGAFGRTHKALAQKCDLCIDRAEGPACISVCPTKALSLIEPSFIEETRLQRRERACVQAANSAPI